MLRSFVSRVAAPRLAVAARTASIPRLTTSLQPATRLTTIRSFATATTSSTSPVTPISPISPAAPTPAAAASASPTLKRLAALDDPLTPEEQNQADWEAWLQAKYNIYVLSILFGGILLVNYWYHREKNHFLHHRHQQEPYAFFINRDDQVGAGFWPGRSCQFLEFNCFAAAYDAAEKMLAEKMAKQNDEDKNKKDKDHH